MIDLLMLSNQHGTNDLVIDNLPNLLTIFRVALITLALMVLFLFYLLEIIRLEDFLDLLFLHDHYNL